MCFSRSILTYVLTDGRYFSLFWPFKVRYFFFCLYVTFTFVYSFLECWQSQLIYLWKAESTQIYRSRADCLIQCLFYIWTICSAKSTLLEHSVLWSMEVYQVLHRDVLKVSGSIKDQDPSVKGSIGVCILLLIYIFCINWCFMYAAWRLWVLILVLTWRNLSSILPDWIIRASFDLLIRLL